MKPRLLLLQSLAATLILATWAAAADWRQFRHDGRRSGQSEDRVPGPLTDIWTLEPGPFKSSRPFGTVAIWRDRLYTFSNENTAPHLVCVDARTGARYWQRALNQGFGTAVARPDVGPAVSPDGTVYAYGTLPFRGSQQEAILQNLNVGNFRGSDPPFVVDMRAYHGLDGRLVASQPLPLGWARTESNLVMSRIFLLHGIRASLLVPPSDRVHWRLTGPFALGPPLLNEGELMALSWMDLFVRWGFGSHPEYTRLAHFSPRYRFLDLHPPARFEGFPSALVAGGVVVADDSTRRFIGVMYPGRSMGWHWDIPWAVGIPSTEAERIFLGIGGPGARAGLVALKSGTGEPIWMFPRNGPPPDAQALATQEEEFSLPTVDGNLIAPHSIKGAMFRLWEPPHRIGLGAVAPDFEPETRAQVDRSQTTFQNRRSGGRRVEPLNPRLVPVTGEQQAMRCPTPGHLTNVGLVLARRRVYGWIANSIACFNQANGEPIWRRQHPVYHPLTSLVASQDQLILCQGPGTFPTTPPTLWGLNLDSGKLEWSMQVPKAGHLAIGHGLLFLNTGESLTAYAPAERTFRMAVDSPEKATYHEDPAGLHPPDPDEAPENPTCEPPVPEEPKPSDPKPATSGIQPPLIQEQKPPPPLAGLADATLLRLQFDQPLDTLLRAARERKRLTGDLPRVLVLDWLTPDRRTRLRGNGHGTWNEDTLEEFVSTCARLAAEFQPDHFEIAPDVNVYLAYQPAQLEAVRSLLRAARAAIRKASPDTRTLISYNAEVLNKSYGRARYFPFKDVPVQPDGAVQRQLSLLEEVDEVGLTTYPQSGNLGPEQVLPPYLLKVVSAFGGKPLLITRVAVRVDDRAPTGPSNQAKFMKRVVQALYWLNARIVAYPDLIGGSEDTTSLKSGDEERPALQLWKDMLRWKRVKELTAARPEPSR